MSKIFFRTAHLLKLSKPNTAKNPSIDQPPKLLRGPIITIKKRFIVILRDYRTCTPGVCRKVSNKVGPNPIVSAQILSRLQELFMIP
ncbi:hypothetical protein L2E82_05270 [Cichorium intybus]|uniref:Uncharacterized protein n=1 Tax=Cichorium intybus TaxID=13427 RepID=A0ACB9H6L7_CICIN|nr:hypothetical protein L2E82_05270 [Cichorium intybus]